MFSGALSSHFRKQNLMGRPKFLLILKLQRNLIRENIIFIEQFGCPHPQKWLRTVSQTYIYISTSDRRSVEHRPYIEANERAPLIFFWFRVAVVSRRVFLKDTCMKFILSCYSQESDKNSWSYSTRSSLHRSKI